MKKLILAGVAATVAMAGINAQAVPVPLNANGTPNIPAVLGSVAETFMTGSSAATPFIVAAMRNGGCATGAPIYRYSDTTAGSFAFLCEKSAGFGAVTQNFLLLHKRDGGGSLNAVRAADSTLPQANSQVFIVNADLANVTTCGVASGATLVSTCSGGTIAATNSRGRVSEAGFADVDPAQFTSPLNGGAVLGGSVVSTAIATQTFGIAVNTRLRNAMQGAAVAAGVLPASCLVANGIGAAVAPNSQESEECMPSLTRSQISSIFAQGRVTDWAQLAYGNTAANQRLFTTNTAVLAAADRPANRDIHICTRTAGSGTLATFQIKFEDAPCNGGLNEAIQTATSQTLGTEIGASGSSKVVHSMSGAGDVESCLEGLNNGTAVGTFNVGGAAPFSSFRWAIGIQGVERNTDGSRAYRFIKIDNVSPSAHNVAEGRYPDWAELVAVSASATITTDPLASAIVTTMSNPATIGSFLNVTHTWGGIAGFLGVATNSAFAPTSTALIAPGTLLNAGFDAARPVNPYSHSASNGQDLNHCRLPTIPGGQTRAIPAFYPVYK
ncbi:MAG: substrate-binding domain-containing protein [Methylococcaceae bacterium]|jgi:hypothetical protein